MAACVYKSSSEVVTETGRFWRPIGQSLAEMGEGAGPVVDPASKSRTEKLRKMA